MTRTTVPETGEKNICNKADSCLQTFPEDSFFSLLFFRGLFYSSFFFFFTNIPYGSSLLERVSFSGFYLASSRKINNAWEVTAIFDENE